MAVVVAVRKRTGSEGSVTIGQQGYREAIETAIAEWTKRQGLSLVTPLSDQVLGDLTGLITANLISAGLIDKPQQDDDLKYSMSEAEHSKPVPKTPAL